MLDSLRSRGFQVEFHSHARSILEGEFPEAVAELEEVLLGATIPIEEIIGSGGGETKGTQRLRRGLKAKGWDTVTFTVEKIINGVARESVSHKMDHVRSFIGDDRTYTIAMEIEWNNKDPFYDRDLENFKRLHADGAISIGVIVTRGRSLHENMRAIVHRFCEEYGINDIADLERWGYVPTPKQKKAIEVRVSRERNPLTFREAWVDKFVSDKFGEATTHWRKLEDRVHRGVGNPCPLVLIGIPDTVVTFGESQQVVQVLIEEGDEDEPGTER
ncbi:BglII/BstYI family type II restriction endonuclease [Mesorhizobium sp. L-8-3]|uniref:BglII/BstYI family type II restriction endonuclease n=1 Tax=Mesorhizobium sp. L-8-3 TaxID=2744522 RepID=UPI0019283284|nr:BglII/BstYI family type II restriction endonuclease [Mesorhizobium sp. L-8-3]BCH24114.1 hypothetical protein MesoLjLb_38990 [Mesorhizobium sp. L-8-3]